MYKAFKTCYCCEEEWERELTVYVQKYAYYISKYCLDCRNRKAKELLDLGYVETEQDVFRKEQY